MSYAPGMRELSARDPERAAILSQRPGGGIGGKGIGLSNGTPKRLNAPERSGQGGRGLGKTSSKKPLKRTRRIAKDTIMGVTKGDIRRLARRGGVKRIAGTIYEDIRAAMKDRLTAILKDVTLFTDHANRKTVTVADVVFALRRLGTPIYGFDHFDKRKQ